VAAGAVVTGDLAASRLTAIASARAPASPGAEAVRIIELTVLAAWVLTFVVLLTYLAVVVIARGSAERRSSAARPGRPRTGLLPAGLRALREADPDFDEQVLLDAAQTATLLVFAAVSTGDETPLSRLVTHSFWQQPFGRMVQVTARDRRRERRQAAKDATSGARRRWWNVPLDYQASVPELVAIRLGTDQRVCVRLSFDQLQAIVHVSGRELAAMAAAPRLAGAMTSPAEPVAAESNGSRTTRRITWLSGGGHYELTFVRPNGARTDPATVLASRTCTTCGATYRSEMAIACAHCGNPRPVAWGQWRLSQAVPVL
jgi:hypothetical protein